MHRVALGEVVQAQALAFDPLPISLARHRMPQPRRHAALVLERQAPDAVDSHVFDLVLRLGDDLLLPPRTVEPVERERGGRLVQPEESTYIMCELHTVVAARHRVLQSGPVDELPVEQFAVEANLFWQAVAIPVGEGRAPIAELPLEGPLGFRHVEDAEVDVPRRPVPSRLLPTLRP